MQKRRDFPDELKILSTIYPKFCILIAIHVTYKICIKLLEAPLRDIIFFKLHNGMNISQSSRTLKNCMVPFFTSKLILFTLFINESRKNQRVSPMCHSHTKNDDDLRHTKTPVEKKKKNNHLIGLLISRT